MRTILTLPPAWAPVARTDERAIWHAGSLMIEIAPLVRRPRDPTALVPRGGTRGPILNRATATGWPYELLAIDDRDTQRLVAVYDFHGDLGVVVITGPAAELAARTPELRAILDSAMPDWRGPIVALAQLWA